MEDDRLDLKWERVHMAKCRSPKLVMCSEMLNLTAEELKEQMAYFGALIMTKVLEHAMIGGLEVRYKTSKKWRLHCLAKR